VNYRNGLFSRTFYSELLNFSRQTAYKSARCAGMEEVLNGLPAEKVADQEQDPAAGSSPPPAAVAAAVGAGIVGDGLKLDMGVAEQPAHNNAENAGASAGNDAHTSINSGAHERCMLPLPFRTG
jgi:hypothetical protein